MASWNEFLAQQQEQAYFQSLMAKLTAAKQQGCVIYPPQHQIFRAFELTALDAVKVVIVGQDPYHQPGQANGLAFSVTAGVKVPPSLRNIYKAIARDYIDLAIPESGDLSKWAQQGALLLNTSLTVEHGKAGAHAKWGWHEFTERALRYLAEHKAAVYLLWGAHAQAAAMKALAGTRYESESLLLTAVHPSPLSAHKGFFDCGHFRLANEWLVERGQSAIEWLPTEQNVSKQSDMFTF
ncbi:MAG: uracil-DNA glycosylase [Aliidiomarina sp.]|uniref:uracil-DNA glycosylase n=1 Tax=Aliidiomarina sp. TaxID=1872439 RepID=UPI0025BF33A9|nr:uracil-DNA glycosylase [Aliidiomarina sp.]MCH8501375.1 uracil-DNA glycosylase [Aliidiomarina sp.]